MSAPKHIRVNGVRYIRADAVRTAGDPWGLGEEERRGPSETYKSLNDAAALMEEPGLEPGSTEVWYQTPEFFRDSGGLIQRVPITRDSYKETHRLLGRISETDPERVFMLMQGEHWSPYGEARELISSKGLGHSSMMVGDVVVINGEPMSVAPSGFKPLE